MIFHHFHDFKIIVARITLFFYRVKVLPILSLSIFGVQYSKEDSMNRFIDELVQIKHNLKGVRDDQIRRKVRLIIRVMESTCVSLECDQLGITRKTFYDWRSKLIKSDFDINSLKNKSHRPKNFPNQTSKEVEDE